jgi:hypothetical protein
MAHMLLADYALDILQFDLARIQECLIALEMRQREAKDEISQRLTRHRLPLARQYDEVIGLVHKPEFRSVEE